MNAPIVAALDENALTGTVFGHLVGPRALAALQHDGIVAHIHVAPANYNVAANIEVDGIRAGSTVLTSCEIEHATCRGIDVAIHIAYTLTTIEMVCPEG